MVKEISLPFEFLLKECSTVLRIKLLKKKACEKESLTSTVKCGKQDNTLIIWSNYVTFFK